MKLTRRQLNKIILESIDLEKSEPDINKLSKEQLKKLKGLLMPYLHSSGDEDTTEFETFKQGEVLIDTFLEEKENPGDYPGVVGLYNKFIKPYRYKKIRKLLRQLIKHFDYWNPTGRMHKRYTTAETKSFWYGTPTNNVTERNARYLQNEESFREGMEMLSKLFKESDSVAPHIYKEQVLPIAEICDKYIEELIELQRSDQHSVDHLLQNYDMTKPGSDAPYYLEKYQKAVSNAQRLLDGESVWVKIKRIIAEYPIEIGKGTKSSVVVQDPLMENKYYRIIK